MNFELILHMIAVVADLFFFLFLNSLKVGTAVVTRSDGRLALGRLGALLEQVCVIFIYLTKSP